MKPKRLQIRLKPAAKELIQRAAVLCNQSVNQFAVSELLKAAEVVVAKHSLTVLSDRDRDLFLRLLDNPPIPNAALRSAAEAHRRSVVR